MAHQSQPILHKSPLDSLSINKYCHRRHSMSTWENKTKILSTIFVNGGQPSRMVSWALFVFVFIVVDNVDAGVVCPSSVHLLRTNETYLSTKFSPQSDKHQIRITPSDEMRLFYSASVLNTRGCFIRVSPAFMSPHTISFGGYLLIAC